MQLYTTATVPRQGDFARGRADTCSSRLPPVVYGRHACTAACGLHPTELAKLSGPGTVHGVECFLVTWPRAYDGIVTIKPPKGGAPELLHCTGRVQRRKQDPTTPENTTTCCLFSVSCTDGDRGANSPARKNGSVAWSCAERESAGHHISVSSIGRNSKSPLWPTH